jgi:hypothetical protein
MTAILANVSTHLLRTPYTVAHKGFLPSIIRVARYPDRLETMYFGPTRCARDD